MSVGMNDITIDHDFQGGLTLATSAVKNGLIAAIDVGLVGKPEATEILFLIREAMQNLLDRMTD